MADGDAALHFTGNQLSTIELLRKDQTRFARILEIQFHSINGIPNISKKVRMLAHTSRTIHSNCVALFRRYQVHGGHIFNTLIPMLKEGIYLNEPTITAGSLESCNKVVTELLNETIMVNKNYAELVPRLKQLKQDILQQNEATDKKARVLRDKLAENWREEYQCEILQRTEGNRSEYDTVDNDEEICRKVANFGVAILSIAMLCFAIVFDGIGRVLFVTGAVICWIYLVCVCLRIGKNNNNAQQRRSFDSSSDTAAFVTVENNSEQLQQLKMEKGSLQREMEAVNGSFLIVDHVEKASVILTGILQQMDRLIGFWQRMLGNIGPLAIPAGASDLHQKTRQEDLYNTFMRKLALTESGWQQFLDASAAYIQYVENNGDERCNVLYQFLSAPIGTPN